MVPGSRIRAPLALAAAIVLPIIGQDQRGPVSVTWRVHRMHDGLYALCGCEDGGSVNRIALHPLPFGESEEALVVLAKTRICQPCQDRARAVSVPIPPVA